MSDEYTDPADVETVSEPLDWEAEWREHLDWMVERESDRWWRHMPSDEEAA